MQRRLSTRSEREKLKVDADVLCGVVYYNYLLTCIIFLFFRM